MTQRIKQKHSRTFPKQFVRLYFLPWMYSRIPGHFRNSLLSVCTSFRGCIVAFQDISEIVCPSLLPSLDVQQNSRIFTSLCLSVSFRMSSLISRTITSNSSEANNANIRANIEKRKRKNLNCNLYKQIYCLHRFLLQHD